MLFSNLNWMQVEDYLKKDDRLMLVIGSTEQHGYLSLATDTKIPLAMAEAAGEKSGVLIAPPIYFGCSPYFLAYPGTISLRLTTLMAIVEDVIRSAYGHGFRRFLILNGHGGNTAVKVFLDELANDLPEMRVRWYAWWQTQTVDKIAIEHHLPMGHASWEEAFSFTRVVDLPDKVKPSVEIKEGVNAEKLRALIGDGSFGGPYQVDDAIMDEIFDACVEEILETLKFEQINK
jgi:creatinine amidohydrolase